MERGTDFCDSVPDRIPGSLLAEFQHRAVREVRRSCRSSPRARALAPFRSTDVWLAGLTLFCSLATILALLGAVVYATVLWPRISLLVMTPAIALFAVSLLIALNTRSRWRSGGVW
ncbi:MAG: hypothetical protein IH850_07565 [Acidobacteria bacterium]|nr:hypothetical protein [Acidobacteriota bacterium]